MKIYSKDKFNRLPDAVLFDIDNTLYAYKPAHQAAQKAIKDKMIKTFSISPEDFDKTFQEAKEQIKERLGATASSHSRLLYLQRMLEIMGLGSQFLLALDFEQTYWRTFLNGAELFDEAKELLDDLRLLDIPMALVTDLTAQIQFRKIIYLNLDPYFNYIVTSEEVGHDKPHLALFQLALKKIRPNGDCIWMIGDSPTCDVQGGRGINAITLQKLHKGVSLGTPDASFGEYSKLRQFIDSLAKQS